jgi:hypothetical protein
MNHIHGDRPTYDFGTFGPADVTRHWGEWGDNREAEE